MVQTTKRGRCEHGAQSWGPTASVFLPKLDPGPLKITLVTDSGEPPDDPTFRGRWQGCVLVGVQNDHENAQNEWWSKGDHHSDADLFGLLYWRMGLTRRASNSSYDGESNTFIEGMDVSLAIQELVDEFEHGVKPTLWQRHTMHDNHELNETDPETVQIEGHTDARDLVDATDSAVYPHGFTKRRKTDIFDVQDLQAMGKAKRLQKIFGLTNPADAGTKKQSWESAPFHRLRSMCQGFYSADKRYASTKQEANANRNAAKRAIQH